MIACGHSSLGNKDRATKCMSGKEGYSSDCAGCFGDTISCTASKCWTKCIGGESQQCKQCVKDNCDAALSSCSGITDFPDNVDFTWLAIADGKCTNAADQQIWESKGKAAFSADMSACGHSSLGNKDRATKCMSGK